MKTVRITLAQAIRIVGSEPELRRLVDRNPEGELALLFTYAKLYRIRRGRWIRYALSGYHAGGGDVDRVLAALAEGQSHLLAGQTAVAA